MRLCWCGKTVVIYGFSDVTTVSLDTLFPLVGGDDDNNDDDDVAVFLLQIAAAAATTTAVVAGVVRYGNYYMAGQTFNSMHNGCDFNCNVQ